MRAEGPTRIGSAPGRDRGHSWEPGRFLSRDLDATQHAPPRCSNSARSQAPLRDARSAQRWLATLPFNDPLVVQREVVTALGAAAERTARRTPSVLAAVFRVDAQTTALARTLMTQYAEIANRSSKIESQLWHALFDLTQGFLACYAAFAREIVDHGHHSRWQTLLPELIARQIVHLGRDAKIRLYRCEPWIPAKWAELHAVFTRACSLQFERQPLLLAPGAGPTTIEREYLIALFLQQADPGNMTPRQIEWVASAARGVVPAAAPHARADRGCDVLRRPREQRRLEAPLGGRRSRDACSSSTRGRCMRCCCRTAPSSSRR